LAIVLGTPIFRSPPVKGASKFNWGAYSFGLASFPFWGSVYAANSLAATWAHLHRGCRERRMRIVLCNNGPGVLRQFFGKLYDKTQKNCAF